MPEGQLEARIDQEQARAEERTGTGLCEAIDTVSEAEAAFSALEEGGTEAAPRALERATGKLAILVAREPDLALAPVLVETELVDSGIVTVDAADRLRNAAWRDFNDNDALTARSLLESLASEVRVRTTSLPLISYPDAMLEAAALVDDGASEAAIAVLETALRTFIVSETYLPIPTITPQALLDEAEKAVNEDRLEDADTLLEEARQELKLARSVTATLLMPNSTMS